MKKMSIELITSAKQHRHTITLTAKFLNALPIEGAYKGLFLDAYRSRGWQNLTAYRDELVDIAQNGCDITKLFLESKLCGLTYLHRIVMGADEKQRAVIYQLIKAHGVKNTRDDVELILTGGADKTLLDYQDEEQI